ncbi:MAG: hypothetical protein RL375_882 [Pseudomonadota bacterium]|jgi:uncharacterized protein YbaR (Trm112 family)
MELLVCPVCKGPLQLDPQTRELVCNADRLAFTVRDGIAIMMENEARHLDAPSDTAATPLA